MPNVSSYYAHKNMSVVCTTDLISLSVCKHKYKAEEAYNTTSISNRC